MSNIEDIYYLNEEEKVNSTEKTNNKKLEMKIFDYEGFSRMYHPYCHP